MINSRNSRKIKDLAITINQQGLSLRKPLLVYGYIISKD